MSYITIDLHLILSRTNIYLTKQFFLTSKEEKSHLALEVC